MARRRMRTRDLLTYGLAVVVVGTILVFHFLGAAPPSNAHANLGNLAAAWDTYGGACGSQNGYNQRLATPCSQIHVEIFTDGTFTVTTLFPPNGKNGDTSGTLTAAQAALLAEARANVDLPTAAPADCGSFVTVQHVKITVVGADGSVHRLDTCPADAPSSPVVKLLQGLTTKAF